MFSMQNRADLKEKSKSNKKTHSQAYEVFTHLLDGRGNALSSCVFHKHHHEYLYFIKIIHKSS